MTRKWLLTLAVPVLLFGTVASGCDRGTDVETGANAPKTTIEAVTQPNVVNLRNKEGETVEYGASAQRLNGVYCITTADGNACDFANDLGLNNPSQYPEGASTDG